MSGTFFGPKITGLFSSPSPQNAQVYCHVTKPLMKIHRIANVNNIVGWLKNSWLSLMVKTKFGR
jgi:hypothetical protein